MRFILICLGPILLIVSACDINWYEMKDPYKDSNRKEIQVEEFVYKVSYLLEPYKFSRIDIHTYKLAKEEKVLYYINCAGEYNRAIDSVYTEINRLIEEDFSRCQPYYLSLHISEDAFGTNNHLLAIDKLEVVQNCK